MTASFSNIPFLKGLSPEALAEVEAEAEWFSLPGGWALFQANEPADGLYVLISGALAAFESDSAAGGAKLLGYIRPGEPVGEMAGFESGAGR